MGTITRRYINTLGDREKVDEVFLLGDKQLRQNRNGNLYLQARLSDRTGTLSAMMWNATERTAAELKNGDYVRVEGATQVFNGSLQVIMTRMERVEETDIDEGEFTRVSAASQGQMREELSRLLGGMANPHLRGLAEAFLADEEWMDQFIRAPAAIKNHHAYVGGLLEHVLSLMRLASLVATHYPQLDRDLLLMGVFLHDVGKVEELAYDRDFAYTDAGQLIGHLVQGVEILNRKLDEYQRGANHPFPAELILQLKHLILSHHGKYEFGSPKLPMTLEAITLNFLDDLDAKLHYVGSVMAEDMNADSAWTPFQATLGRKLFKWQAPEPRRE